MSTTVTHVQTISPAARQRRKKIRRLKRNLRIAAFSALTCTIVVMSINHNKNVQALNSKIQDLSGQVYQLTEANTRLTEANTKLTASLRDNERALGMLVDTNEISAAWPVTYNIPLDAALQEYTYNLCVDYYIPEQYELVLAIMWQESDFKADAVSYTDDYGIMQINKINHGWLKEELGVDDFLDVHQNIHSGVYMLAKLIHKYGDASKALMAYNMGERGAASYWSSGIYSNDYCASVFAKCAAIKADSYR